MERLGQDMIREERIRRSRNKCIGVSGNLIIVM